MTDKTVPSYSAVSKEKAVTPTYAAVLKWLVILAMPFFLGFGVIGGVVAWDYPAWEYQRIAPDAYGWDDDTRLALAQETLRYMQRPEPAEEVIYILEDIRLPEDQTQPLYNEREIKHMLDVKNLTDNIRYLWWAATVLVVGGLVALIARPETRLTAYQAIYGGGWATIIILTGIALFILIGWSFFFTFFHELLFPPGTWTFFYTDSLIRLFPEQFWFDVGVILSITPLILGVITAIIGFFLKRSAV